MPAAKSVPPPAPKRTFPRVLGCAGVTALVALVGISSTHLALALPARAPTTWGVDVTYALPPAAFVRMHNLIATHTPFELGKPTAPIGTGTLNRYVGAAHATCHALRVADLAYDFRICTSTEVLALSAVIPLNASAHIVTYASSDGDDYEIGAVKTQVEYVADDTYTYDPTASPPPGPLPPSGSPLAPPPSPPPPPSPRPPTLDGMQVFMGSDREVNLGTLRAHTPLVAYCCAGVYTHMTGEGPS